ncbi:His-Xaa-Ser repeat protein HxsA [Spongiibacter tropicus]|uniref:His-Xaa-Ser repeat protein HxsA n=1 Tax=Spongiibacter tropicus TaxID=454602 RepID=UPI0035BE42C2
MKKRLGLAALLPGFVSLNSSGMDTAMENAFESKDVLLDNAILTPLNTETPLYLAAHRSHASHSSHGSHRSSSGGGYSAPSKPAQRSTPITQPAKPSYTNPSSSASSTKSKSGGGDTNLMRKEIISRVQMALYLLDYYKGAIDGIMGPSTRKALASYRIDKNLRVVEGIDVEVLNSLGISTR